MIPHLLLTLLHLTLTTSTSSSTTNQSSFNHTSAATAITSSLSSFATIQKGSFTFFFLKDCSKYHLPSCFALNADSPYGLTLLPPAPAEQNPFRGCVTKTGRCGNSCNPTNDPDLFHGVCVDQLPMQWRLGQDEAVVLIGRSPPRTKYWSITSYLMSQYYDANTSGPWLHPV